MNAVPAKAGATLTAVVVGACFSLAAANAQADVEGPSPSDLRPAHAATFTRVCSFRFPFCLWAAPGTERGFVVAALESGERAWSTLADVLGAPAPEGALGDPWPVYLVDGVEGDSFAVSDMRDPLSRFDEAATFALVDRATPAGCRLDLALARAIAAGSLLRAVPGASPGTLRSQSEALADLAAACAAPAEDAYTFQSEPWRCVVDPTDGAFDRGASIFFDWIDARFGNQPGSLITGTWALAAPRTGAPTPSLFDVLRESLRGAYGRGTDFDDVLADFAVERASLVPRPALSWSLPWPAHARRVAPAHPLDPTGASYVRIDREGAPAGAKLRLEAAWEDFARMRWSVLKRDASGRTLAEFKITSSPLATNASTTIENLDDVDHLLVVVENLGSTEHPFSPDQEKWEPHGWTLTVEGEPSFGP
jgi:hypothetical protein